MNKTLFIKLICFFAMVFLVTSCGGGGGSDDDSSSKTVSISWTANLESGVNSTGGGYKIYYSDTSGVDASSASSVDVPYVSGSSAPTSVDVELSAGTYYIKIAAYSALNTGGSDLSDEVSLTVSE